MQTYRHEIIETQKVRSDLLKWKLILCAVLGGIGLGLRGVGLRGMAGTNSFSSGGLDSHIYLTLCLIPPVCAYVDILCYHLNLRMFVIARFLKDPRRRIIRNFSNDNKKSINDTEAEYENFRLYEKICEEERDAFELESFALKASSIVLSFILIILPFVVELDNQTPELDNIILVVSGFFGIIAAIWIESSYQKKLELLNQTEQDQQNNDKQNKTNKIYQELSGKYNKLYCETVTAMRIQIIYMFAVSILFFVYYCYFIYLSNSSTILSGIQITHDIEKCKRFGLLPAISIILVWLVLICFFAWLIIKVSRYILNEFKFLKEDIFSEEKQNAINKCYSFLLENKSETNTKTVLKDLRTFFVIQSILLLVILVSTFTYGILNLGNFISSFPPQLSQLDLKKTTMIFAMLGLSWLVLIPFFYDCFRFHINRLSELRSFLPKDLGHIQEHFIGGVYLDQDNDRDYYQKEIEFYNIQEKIDLHKKSGEKNYKLGFYIHLIKCSKGIAIVNTGKIFVDYPEATIIVKNSNKINSLKTGKYWQIEFNFQVNIGIDDSKKNPNNSKKDTDKSKKDIYIFQNWEKISKKGELENGLEIGDDTAL